MSVGHCSLPSLFPSLHLLPHSSASSLSPSHCLVMCAVPCAMVKVSLQEEELCTCIGSLEGRCRKRIPRGRFQQVKEVLQSHPCHLPHSSKKWLKCLQQRVGVMLGRIIKQCIVYRHVCIISGAHRAAYMLLIIYIYAYVCVCDWWLHASLPLLICS